MSRHRAQTSRSCPNSAPAPSCRSGRAAHASGGCRKSRRSSPAPAPTRRYRCRARYRRCPEATAAADPADEPPGTCPGARGFTGVPSNGFSPSMPSETSSVIVLPISSAPASSSVCTAQACRCRNRMGPGPIRVAAAGRTAGDIEQILGREGQAGKRPAGAPGDAEKLARAQRRRDRRRYRSSVHLHLPPLRRISVDQPSIAIRPAIARPCIRCAASTILS